MEMQAPDVKNNMAFEEQLTQQQMELRSSVARCALYMVEAVIQQVASEY